VDESSAKSGEMVPECRR